MLHCICPKCQAVYRENSQQTPTDYTGQSFVGMKFDGSGCLVIL